MKDSDISRATVDTVAKRLGLPWDSWVQDWDIEMAWGKDAERLIGSYNPSDSPEARVVTMRFMIAAYDAYLGESPPVADWERQIRHWLLNDWATHAKTVEYWSALDPHFEDGVDIDDGFCISPLMRAIWREQQKQT